MNTQKAQGRNNNAVSLQKIASIHASKNEKKLSKANNTN
jgi:hypothetical protein